MTSKKYMVETNTGQPVFTTGIKPTLTKTDRRLTCLEVDGSERCRELWEKRLGQAIRFVEAGTCEYINA